MCACRHELVVDGAGSAWWRLAAPTTRALGRFAVGHVALCLLSLLLFGRPESSPGIVLWFADGWLLAHLIDSRPSRWPLYVATSAVTLVAAELLTGASPARALALLPAHLVTALLGAALVRATSCVPSFSVAPKQLLVLLSLGAAVPAAVGGAMAAATLASRWTDAPFLELFSRCAMGATLGTMVELPVGLMYVLTAARSDRPWRVRVPELPWILAAGGAVGLGLAVLSMPPVFALLVPLSVAALRLDFRGAARGQLVAWLPLGVFLSRGGLDGPFGSTSLVLGIEEYASLALCLVLPLVLAASAEARRRALEGLAASEAKLKTMFEVLPVGVSITDPSGQIVDCNRASEALLGIRRDEHLQRSYAGPEWTIVRPDGTSMPPAEYASVRALSSGQPVRDVEMGIERANGTTWLSVSAMPAGHTDYGVVIAYVDVTERRRMHELVSERERALREAQALSKVGSWDLDLSTGAYTLSPQLLDIFGLASAPTMDRERFDAFFSPEHWAALKACIECAHERGERTSCEVEVRRPDGGRRWTIATVTSANDSGGRGGRISGVFQDVSERREADRRRQLAENVFAYAREGIVITDAAGVIVDTNQAYCRIMGYPREEILGRNPKMFGAGRHDRGFFERMWRELQSRGAWAGEIWDRRKNGEVFAGLLSISAVRDAAGVPLQYVGLISDITPMKEQTAQLERIARSDALTGLANRTVLMEHLRQAMAQARRDARPLAVLFVDLDGFKDVNDRLGHETGDRLLISVARRMREALREADMIARVGGDEFVVVLSDVASEAAIEPTCARILEAASTEEPAFSGRGPSMGVTASVGVVLWRPSEPVAVEELMRRADQAMYDAKLSGRNRFWFYDAARGREEVSRRAQLERLRLALGAGELVIHYQPKVNLRTLDFVGAEALLRWQHPALGLLAPADFLPSTEGDPLGLEIDTWVIERVLSQLEAWHRAGLSIPVSANLSAAQLRQPHFAEQLRAAVTAHPDAPPGVLELELPEPAALEDLRRTARLVDTCRALSVGVALDDFGTGGVSLAQLQALHVPEVKLDQGLVRDMLDDPGDLELLAAAAQLATAFGRRIVAEGIESMEQVAVLGALGCELGQGNGIASPMPVEALLGWASTWGADPRRPQRRAESPVDLPLLLGAVEMRARAWRFARELASVSEELVRPVGSSECRLGAWLAARAATNAVARADHAQLEALHLRFHAQLDLIATLHARGDVTATHQRLEELNRVSEALFALACRMATRAPLEAQTLALLSSPPGGAAARA